MLSLTHGSAVLTWVVEDCVSFLRQEEEWEASAIYTRAPIAIERRLLLFMDLNLGLSPKKKPL